MINCHRVLQTGDQAIVPLLDQPTSIKTANLGILFMQKYLIKGDYKMGNKKTDKSRTHAANVDDKRANSDNDKKNFPTSPTNRPKDRV